MAESSLTVPGVRVVVDAGLAREPRTDQGRGLGSLTTVRVSKASAAQRAGRAGREAPGAVYRCWTAAEHDRLPDHAQPEIALADLTGFALQAACWGTPDASSLALLDPPPAASMAAAGRTLHALGALEGGTGHLAGAPDGGHRRASPAGAGADRRPGEGRRGRRPAVRRAAALRARTTWWRSGARHAGRAAATGAGRPAACPRPRATGGPAARARPRPGTGAAREPARQRAARVIAAGTTTRWPGWWWRSPTPSGWRAGAAAGTSWSRAPPPTLPEASRLASAEWLAIAVADRPAGSASARVRQAAVIDEDVAKEAAGPFHQVADEIRWDGDVVARRVERLGAVELSSAPLKGADVRDAILAGLRAEGLSLLRWTPESVAVRERMAFCRRVLGDPWPEVSDAALIASADSWLDLPRLRRRSDLAGVDVAAALKRLLTWRLRLDEVAPERVTVPTGSRIRVDYSGDQPVLAAKLQELFGWDAAPADRRCAAGRPSALTGGPARRRHRRPGVVLARRLPRRARRTPWPLPETPVAGGPAQRRPDPPDQSGQAPVSHPAWA